MITHKLITISLIDDNFERIFICNMFSKLAHCNIKMNMSSGYGPCHVKNKVHSTFLPQLYQALSEDESAW